MAELRIIDPKTERAYHEKRWRRYNLPGEPRAMTFSSSASLLHGNPLRRRLVAKPDDWEWSSARWFAGDRPVTIEMDGQVTCMQVQAHAYQAQNGPRHSLVPGPTEGEFYRRTKARHNSIGALKMPIFPGNQTTGCQLSQWRAVGGGSPSTLELPSLFHSAPVRDMARCGVLGQPTVVSLFLPITHSH